MGWDNCCCNAPSTQELGVPCPAAVKQTFTKLTQFSSVRRAVAECLGAGPASHHSSDLPQEGNLAMLLELI